MTDNRNECYIARDGNWGNAEGIAICDVSSWTFADWQALDEMTDLMRRSYAFDYNHTFPNALPPHKWLENYA
jgi:hypothetical protein